MGLAGKASQNLSPMDFWKIIKILKIKKGNMPNIYTKSQNHL
jgi:hypothetical protein